MAKKINFKTLSERAVQAAGLAGGVAASRMVGKALESKVTNPKINALIRIGVGAVLPSLVGGNSKKSGLIDNVANGILADGAAALGGAFKIPGLHGTGSYDSVSGDYDALSYAAQEDLMSGTGSYDSVSGHQD